MVFGWCALFLWLSRLIRSAIVLKPSTLLHLHHVLIQRKYRLLFSPKGRRKPGPKGPSQELMAAIVATKQRNPSWGCPRIALSKNHGLVVIESMTCQGQCFSSHSVGRRPMGTSADCFGVRRPGR